MKKCFQFTTLILALSILNYLLISSPQPFSEGSNSPFQPLKNLRSTKPSEIYNKEYSAIPALASENINSSNETMTNGNTFQQGVLLSHASVDTENTLSQKIIVRQTHKQNILWFYAFLFLIGNVHLVFSIAVLTFRLRDYQSKVFVVLSFLQGIWYVAIAEYIFTSWFVTIFSIITALLASSIVLSCCYLGGMKLRPIMYIALSIITIAFLIIALSPLLLISPRIKIAFAFLYLFGVAIISNFILAKRIFETRNTYAKKHRFPYLYAMSISFLIPPALFATSLFYAFPLPAQYFPLFSLAFPVFMGQNIFHYNLFSSRYLFLRSSAIFIVNIATAIIMAVMLYAIAKEWQLIHPSVWFFLYFVVYTSFIAITRNLRRKLINALIVDRANQSRSLQNIELMVATPEPLDYKIERIFTEISLILGISEIRLLLFCKNEDFIEIHKSTLVEKLPNDNFLATYFAEKRTQIFSFELIPHQPIDQKILHFMDENRFVFALPIFSQEKILAVLMLGSKQNGELYFSHDVNYLETIALQIRQMLENNQLLNSYIARRHFEMELDIASFVQSRLFPRQAPTSSKMAISFYNRPYLKVTGDYFDFIEIDRKNTAIIIGDISGHGLAAAMILSMISSTFHALLKEKFSIEKVIEEINYLLNNRYKGTELITLFAGIYNSTTGQLRYINAGHCTPLVLKKKTNSFTALEGRSKIVGADTSALYLASLYNFEKGDELFLYTDGATEIYDEKTGRLFSESDLIETLRKNAHRDIEGKIHALIEKINSFGDAIHDDITLIAIRFR
ncbi:MAG: SpoIIE family protein phosphatase [Spirochaetes bacterium]|nr:SpoIIE family protein phosphatase [Spirochaetota bacterium]